jgi:acyl dehydratase
MALAGVAGRRYGPVRFDVDRSRVDAFVAATGDDPGRWKESAPPSLAAAVLFAVAPAFLGDDDVAGTTRSLIHTEQEFRWHGPAPIGSELAVIGEVTSVRERRGLNLVSFAVTADAGRERRLDGAAVFLMSGEAAASGEEEPEPPHDARAVDERPSPASLPSAGGTVSTVLRSASRGDLVRYAAASGDWNPIHWDHEAAVAAGLPGVVCHGLLMASWLVQSAARHREGDHPLETLRLRFRRPLRPARQAEITVRGADAGELALVLSAGGETLVTAFARVTA